MFGPFLGRLDIARDDRVDPFLARDRQHGAVPPRPTADDQVVVGEGGDDGAGLAGVDLDAPLGLDDRAGARRREILLDVDIGFGRLDRAARAIARLAVDGLVAPVRPRTQIGGRAPGPRPPPAAPPHPTAPTDTRPE